MQGVRGGDSGPWTFVIIDRYGKKVIDQEIVKIRDLIPAVYESMKRKHPRNVVIAIEDHGGMIVYNEVI